MHAHAHPHTPMHAHISQAEAPAVEAALVHGGVLPHEALAESALLLEEEVAVAVVVQQPLRQVEQGAQLAQRPAVGLHLARLVRHAEEDAAAAGGDVAPLVDDVEEAAAHHLGKEEVDITDTGGEGGRWILDERVEGKGEGK